MSKIVSYKEWGQFWVHIWRSSELLKNILWPFTDVLMIIKYSLKIDLIMSEPHNANLFHGPDAQLLMSDK